LDFRPSHNHYLDYQLIPSNDYRGKIRYFDKHQEAFDLLDHDQRIDIHLNFAKALFEIRKKGKSWYDLSKAVAIVLMFSAVSILFAELVIVSSFYLEYLNEVMLLRNTLLICASSILIGREIAMIWAIRKEIQS